MIPALVRSVIYPLHERLLHRPTFAYLRDIEQSQWLSRAEIEALQQRKLADLLRSAEAHCPWFTERIRMAGIDTTAEQIDLEQLRRLPTMTRADAQEHGDRMVWREVPGGAYSYNTGGSSGQPLIFHYGRLRQASDAAGRIRARRWWGVEFGEPEVFLWGAPVELNKTDRIKTLRDRLFNQLLLNAFEMSPPVMDQYIAAIRRFRPRCLYGYSSSVALLAGHARERGQDLRLPSLRLVCVTGEPVYPQQRAAIEEVFGAPVASEFGSRDSGLMAHESPDGQMLMMSESVLMEVLDGQGEPVAPGELGEAVITGLCSEAQPFIRYRTGDMVRLSTEGDRGGRGLHVLESVAGRRTDFIVKPDGTIMHALGVIYVLRAVEGVREFKIVQHDLRRVEVLVVRGEHWRPEGEAEIRQGLRARLGDEVTFEIRYVDAIPPESSGKFRYVVSHVELPYAAVEAR